MFILLILMAFIFATLGSLDLIRYINLKINTSAPTLEHKPIHYLLKSIVLFICIISIFLLIYKLNIHPHQTVKLR